MLTLVPDEIEEYALAHTTDPGKLFAELAAELRQLCAIWRETGQADRPDHVKAEVTPVG